MSRPYAKNGKRPLAYEPWRSSRAMTARAGTATSQHLPQCLLRGHGYILDQQREGHADVTYSRDSSSYYFALRFISSFWRTNGRSWSNLLRRRLLSLVFHGVLLFLRYFSSFFLPARPPYPRSSLTVLVLDLRIHLSFISFFVRSKLRCACL